MSVASCPATSRQRCLSTFQAPQGSLVHLLYTLPRVRQRQQWDHLRAFSSSDLTQVSPWTPHLYIICSWLRLSLWSLCCWCLFHTRESKTRSSIPDMVSRRTVTSLILLAMPLVVQPVRAWSLLWAQGWLMINPLVHQGLQVISCNVAFCPVGPQSVIEGVFMLPSAELHEASVISFLQPVRVPLKTSLAPQCVSRPSQNCRGWSHPFIQVLNIVIQQFARYWMTWGRGGCRVVLMPLPPTSWEGVAKMDRISERYPVA